MPASRRLAKSFGILLTPLRRLSIFPGERAGNVRDRRQRGHRDNQREAIVPRPRPIGDMVGEQAASSLCDL
jgi:hypothetical protein